MGSTEYTSSVNHPEVSDEILANVAELPDGEILSGGLVVYAGNIPSKIGSMRLPWILDFRQKEKLEELLQPIVYGHRKIHTRDATVPETTIPEL